MTVLPKLALLAGSGDSTAIVYNGLQAQFPWVRVILENAVSSGEILQRRIRKLGVRKVAGQVAFRAGVVPVLRVLARRRVQQIVRQFALDVSPPPESLVTRVASANDPDTIRLLRELAPAVIVVNGTRLLSKELLSSVPSIFLNTHAGVTPMYRGVHGGYWALAEERRDLCGVTVHLVDVGIDTGATVGRAMINPSREDNFVTYPYLQLAAALPLLRQAVHDALETGHVKSAPPLEGVSRLWSHPTIWEYFRNRLRFGVR